MPSLAQIEANRRNAQKSTGPTSAAGKAVSSLNALKTGLHAKSLVLPYENRADLDQLIEEYYRQHAPATPEARLFIDELIHCEWQLRRLRACETEMWVYQNTDKYRDPEAFPLGKSGTYNSAAFSKIQHRLDATRRAYHRSLQALKHLEAETAPTPEPVPPPEQPNAPLGAPPPQSLPTPSPQTTSPQIGFVPSTPSHTPPQPPNAVSILPLGTLSTSPARLVRESSRRDLRLYQEASEICRG